MKTILPFLFIALTAVPCETYGWAHVATDPRIVRHTYADGTYTEVDCTRVSRDEPKIGCVLTVSAYSKRKKFQLNMLALGYSHSEAVGDHLYWPSIGGQSFVIRFPVQCNSEDISIAALVDPEKLSCQLNLRLTDRSTLSAEVEIYGDKSDGTRFNHTREIAGA